MMPKHTRSLTILAAALIVAACSPAAPATAPTAGAVPLAATVIAPTAFEADAYSTALFVCGEFAPERLKLVHRPRRTQPAADARRQTLPHADFTSRRRSWIIHVAQW